MTHYIDIQIKPDAEMRINQLLNKVYSKFHKALFALKSTEIGVSFPKYKIMLGDVIRIHGNENNLTVLQSTNWLGGLVGYCSVQNIQEAPSVTQYRTVSRKQANMSNAKLKRLVKRGTITELEIKGYKSGMFKQGLENPYFELESTSNGHFHRRYIQFGELKSESSQGSFDQFGLSKIATIPWF